MSVKADKLEFLVPRLYEAALRPELWRVALKEISDTFGADGAAVFSDPGNMRLGGYFSEGLDELVNWVRELGPGLHNPRPERALRCSRPGQAITEGQLFSDWELTHLPFNVGMVDRCKLRWDAGGNVGTPKTPIFLTVQRRSNKERFQQQDLEALESLFPHLRRAADIAMSMAEVHAAGVMDGLTAANTAAVLLDYKGQPCGINAHAQALMGDAVRIERGGLVAMSRSGNRALQQVIAAALAPPKLRRTEKIPVATLPRRRARPLLVQGLPLAGSAGDLFRLAKAILVFKDPDASLLVEERALRHLFGLTPAEIRIALGIADGQDLRALATTLRIEVGTARVHLRSVMQKTGTHRQSEVAALLARLAALTHADYCK